MISIPRVLGREEREEKGWTGEGKGEPLQKGSTFFLSKILPNFFGIGFNECLLSLSGFQVIAKLLVDERSEKE